MPRSAIYVAAGALAAFGLIQFARPATTPNPPVNEAHALAAQLPGHPVVTVVERACQDCHSNETAWPWYSRVAPASWVVAHHVSEARAEVNFSEWTTYSAERQQRIWRHACGAAMRRDMPLRSYVLAHPEAALDFTSVRAICDLAQMN